MVIDIAIDANRYKDFVDAAPKAVYFLHTSLPAYNCLLSSLLLQTCVKPQNLI